MNDCVFCPENWPNIVSDDWMMVQKFDLGIDDPEMLIFTPLNPVTEGHVLIVHRQHSDDLSKNLFVAADLMQAAAAYVRAKDIQANIITSIGPDATQTVFHTHIHVVPRKPGDNLPLPWTPQHEVKSLEQAVRLKVALRESGWADGSSVGLFQQRDTRQDFDPKEKWNTYWSKVDPSQVVK